uniref:Uncharacterized protein n=1 Tax=Chromera velia CCMP2878 TaxID=1169474 RepID=A0A0G4HGH8_9ALVE|eukprot:Cvel_27207.t1-p1 / transcript=Cvel_27207.t1 / gene=Cvel_27207 / organism=Chromera_velia_CCMP2878 / gene_product=hypothetical protein / transcript_product=hypothetical protein / location=Cvel_scaffold3360:6902-12955(+) / protein_length=628 / sequence_SO=supercontig / SO=protein_coding / is_pseudo=false
MAAQARVDALEKELEVERRQTQSLRAERDRLVKDYEELRRGKPEDSGVDAQANLTEVQQKVADLTVALRASEAKCAELQGKVAYLEALPPKVEVVRVGGGPTTSGGLGAAGAGAGAGGSGRLAEQLKAIVQGQQREIDRLRASLEMEKRNKPPPEKLVTKEYVEVVRVEPRLVEVEKENPERERNRIAEMHALHREILDLQAELQKAKAGGTVRREVIPVESGSSAQVHQLIASLNEKEAAIGDLRRQLHDAENRPPVIQTIPQELFIEVPTSTRLESDKQRDLDLEQLRQEVVRRRRAAEESQGALMRAGVSVQSFSEWISTLRYIEDHLTYIIGSTPTDHNQYGYYPPPARTNYSPPPRSVSFHTHPEYYPETSQPPAEKKGGTNWFYGLFGGGGGGGGQQQAYGGAESPSANPSPARQNPFQVFDRTNALEPGPYQQEQQAPVSPSHGYETGGYSLQQEQPAYPQEPYQPQQQQAQQLYSPQQAGVKSPGGPLSQALINQGIARPEVQQPAPQNTTSIKVSPPNPSRPMESVFMPAAPVSTDPVRQQQQYGGAAAVPTEMGGAGREPLLASPATGPRGKQGGGFSPNFLDQGKGDGNRLAPDLGGVAQAGSGGGILDVEGSVYMP